MTAISAPGSVSPFLFTLSSTGTCPWNSLRFGSTNISVMFNNHVCSGVRNGDCFFIFQFPSSVTIFLLFFLFSEIELILPMLSAKSCISGRGDEEKLVSALSQPGKLIPQAPIPGPLASGLARRTSKGAANPISVACARPFWVDARMAAKPDTASAPASRCPRNRRPSANQKGVRSDLSASSHLFCSRRAFVRSSALSSSCPSARHPVAPTSAFSLSSTSLFLCPPSSFLTSSLHHSIHLSSSFAFPLPVLILLRKPRRRSLHPLRHCPVHSTSNPIIL